MYRFEKGKHYFGSDGRTIYRVMGIHEGYIRLKPVAQIIDKEMVKIEDEPSGFTIALRKEIVKIEDAKWVKARVKVFDRFQTLNDGLCYEYTKKTLAVNDTEGYDFLSGIKFE